MDLDFHTDQLRRLLEEASAIAARHYRVAEDARIFPDKTVSELRAMFDEPLPLEPLDAARLLEIVERDILSMATLSGSPNYYAFISSCGNPFGLLGEVLSAAINQPVMRESVFPSATAVERQVIRWIAEFIGYPTDAGGLLVSGGSVANLICLAVARKVKSPFDVASEGVRAGPAMTLYVSTEGHHSLDKAVDVLGLGKRHLRKIPVRDDCTIDLAALESRILEDRAAGFHPFCVIANGGTVNTGAVDPLDALADLCAEHDLWLHVDGAYGAPAAATRIAGELFKGLERADSVILDPHKWFYIPYEAGCVLIKDRHHLRETFDIAAAYAKSETDEPEELDFMDQGLQMSRNFKALKVWMTFKGYGAERLKSAIEENIATMHYLVELIDRSDDFEMLAPSPLSSVCFRYRPADVGDDESYIEELNKRLIAAIEKDGRVYLRGTRVHGRTSLRACSVKYRTEPRHVEYLLEVLRELGASL
ncbi:MAG: aminotransferase class I/II-fold pyridoxal phosphate-dependent enzyme [Blastocatellia bacterium]|nr:aminotransferase class I/II-fold pyridoxal phosphate-dependent enzyme [Blastocatellia bacterium]